MPRRPRNFDVSNLVGHAEIAERLKVRADTVHKWRQRYDDFPEPFADLAIGPVFWWPDVEAWYEGKHPDNPGVAHATTTR